MKYANQHAVTTFALIAIVPMLLTVPLPVMAGDIHGKQTGQNVSLGSGSFVSNTSGKHNTALGHKALHLNTQGQKNTALGRIALRYNNRGSWNTAVGSEALWKNTIGNNNTAVGSQALNRNTTGSHNTASGVNALQKNTRGNNNTASGYRALHNNTDGLNNTASGAYAFNRNTTGSENTVLGAKALMGNRNGSKNTVLGYNAGASSITGSNNVYIGYKAGHNTTYHNRSNKLVIANGNTLDDELISGSFSEHVVDINGQLNVQGELTAAGDASIGGTLNAQAVAMTSDGRLKKDIKPLTHALDSILQLQGKTYRWKEDTTFANKQDIGLVAQDVEKVFPQLVTEDERDYKGIAYSKLTAVLIEAMKEQQQQITTLQQENQQLKSAMAEQMQALLARVAMLEGTPLVAN